MNKFVHMLDQKENAYTILFSIAKYSSRRVLPICIPTKKVWKCLFPQSFTNELSNRKYFHILKFLPIH